MCVFWEWFSESQKTHCNFAKICPIFSELPSETISCIFGWCMYQNKLGLSGSLITCSVRSDFNLNPGCFGTDIIQKCTKWYHVGVHGLKIGQMFPTFQCMSYLVRNDAPKTQKRRYRNWIMINFVKQIYVLRFLSMSHINESKIAYFDILVI